MSIIQIKNGSFSYGGETIFKNINFSVNNKDRIGLVGDNGAGKSTLLKCLLGIYDLNLGEILTRNKRSKIAYVPQNLPHEKQEITLEQFLINALPKDERESYIWKAQVAMQEIGIPHEYADYKLNELSGGWQRMALIAKTYMEDPDLLIIDEPTNHLDLGKIYQLENWVNNIVKIPFIVVSHDRYFLDNCTNRTLTLRQGLIIDHNLPYTKSKEIILEQDILDAKMLQREEEEVKRLERSAKRLIVWGRTNPALAKKGKAIQTRADRIKNSKTDVYKEDSRKLELNKTEIKSNVLFRTKNTVIKTPEPDNRALFKITNEFAVNKGDRVAILGLNGIGKTLFIKQIMKSLKNPINEKDTKMMFSPQADVGYFDQHIDNISNKISIFEYIEKINGVTTQKATSSLSRAGFKNHETKKEIGKCSMGEKARIAFLGMNLQNHNFFVMDEPTNHIDISGQEDFENEMIDKNHSCIFVSHDRFMINNIANRYMLINDKKLIEIFDPQIFYNLVKESESL